jgi:hypothetical protein
MIGSIETEADLQRFVQQILSSPNAFAPGSIGGGVLVSRSITEEKIAYESVTNDLIVPGTITGDRIAAQTITGNLIAANTITANNITAGTITGAEIAAETITGANIAAGTLTAGKIEAGAITTELLAAEAVTAGKVKVGALTATQIEAGSITGDRLKANTVEAGQIKAQTITATEIASGTITANQIASHTIVAGNIAAGTITTTEIAAGTVKAEDIEAHTITATQIASGTITAAEIASGTITGGNIASGTITASNINVAKLSALTADAGEITAGTITGATVRTASSGNRVVIDAAGLHAYKGISTAVLDFDIETGNLKVKGTIEEGSTIPAPTITGLLTNAQIEAIAAAKITGQVSGSQIAANSIESSHIVSGTIVAGDIAAGTITANEIKGETITATQIKSGTITTTEIKTGTILGEDIAATTITGSNIAANTIAASKLTVSELSAITANLGSITAGTITGGTFQTAVANPKVIMDSSGLRVVEAAGTAAATVSATGVSIRGSTTESIPVARKLSYLREGTTEGGSLGMVEFATSNRLNLSGLSPNGSNKNYLYFESSNFAASNMVALNAQGNATVEVVGGEGTFGSRQIRAGIGGVVEPKVLIDDAGRSAWLQLAAALSTKKVAFGKTKIEQATEENGWYGTITHGLGTTPILVVACDATGTFQRVCSTTEYKSTTFRVGHWRADGAKSKSAEIAWIAIG